MQNVRITAIFLLLVMLMGALAACGGSGGEGAAADTTAAITDAAEETTEEVLKADLPDVDYNGDIFTMYMRKSDGYACDFDVAELSGDTIDDAVYERNSKVAEKFNIVFEIIRDGDNFGLNTARTAVLAGDDSIDLLIPHARFVFPYALEGLLYDWQTDLIWVDLDKPWWNDDARAAFSLCNNLFAMVGDISYTNLGSTKSMLFNKNILSQLGLASPYPMVNSGEWTMDKMAELTKSAAADLNGDGKYNIADDRYGYITTHWSGPIQVLYSANQRIARKDENDLLYLTLNTETTVNAFEKFFAITDAEGGYIQCEDGVSGVTDCFRAGHALFYDVNIGGVKALRDMDEDFGIIPWPKFDETIDKYYANVDAGCNLFIVPVTNADPEQASVILEALCYEGYLTVLPTYYDVVLTTKFTRDAESEDMIDIIRAGRVFDIGYYFFDNSNDLNSVGWYLTKTPDRSFASVYAKYEPVVLAQYKKVNEKFLALE
ncbi:MAG: extracellular solute-binding protein [Clostridiales bacterium]|nr:extracellular solute-binding protein [Clostridiales bacterium]